MKKATHILYLLLVFNTPFAMSQNTEASANNVITQGFQLATEGTLNGTTLNGITLTLKQPLDGVGGSTWLLETANKELVILTFYWSVKPDAQPELNKKYRLSSDGKIDFIDKVNVENRFHRDSNGNLNARLFGDINQNTKIDINKSNSFITDIKSAEFMALLNKYNIKIVHQTLK